MEIVTYSSTSSRNWRFRLLVFKNQTKEKKLEWEPTLEDGKKCFQLQGIGVPDVLPKKVMRWAGLKATDPEVKRMISVAITELQTSQMWAVKAVTWDK